MTLQANSHRPLRTVLIGTVLESKNDPVVRAGLAIARAVGARVHLVHAVPRNLSPATGLRAALSEELRAWCKEKLLEQIDRMGIGKPERSRVPRSSPESLTASSWTWRSRPGPT